MNSLELKELEAKHLMRTYARQDLALEYGKGCRVYDKEGAQYLDFLGGIATCTVGHANEAVCEAISSQSKKLINATNLYYTEPQAKLASELAGLSGLSKCFFANSGTEANEAALKLAKKITGRKKFIAFENGFHGRSQGSLAATWKEAYRKPFEPLSPSVEFVKYDSIPALEAAMSREVAAVIMEPIQGEAGVIVPSAGYMKEAKEVCGRFGALLIADEVQTGNGRTGKFYAYQHEGIIPDIVTSAKGLANGVPIGVCISNLEFGKSEHGSTFGGNSLACAAAVATISEIRKLNLMQNASEVGGYFMDRLNELKGAHAQITEVRGKGLMVGMELSTSDAESIVARCLKGGLIINNTAKCTLRFLPPLIATRDDAALAVKIISEALS